MKTMTKRRYEMRCRKLGAVPALRYQWGGYSRVMFDAPLTGYQLYLINRFAGPYSNEFIVIQRGEAWGK